MPFLICPLYLPCLYNVDIMPTHTKTHSHSTHTIQETYIFRSAHPLQRTENIPPTHIHATHLCSHFSLHARCLDALTLNEPCFESGCIKSSSRADFHLPSSLCTLNPRNHLTSTLNLSIVHCTRFSRRQHTDLLALSHFVSAVIRARTLTIPHTPAIIIYPSDGERGSQRMNL